MTQVKSANSFTFTPEEVIAVSVDEFVSGTKIPADVFVKLSDNRYVLVGRQGTKVAFNEMHLTEHEAVSNLYVRRADYKNCVGQNLTVAGIMINRDDISAENKANFLSKSTDTVLKEIAVLGFNHEAMEHARQVSASIQTLVASKDDLQAIMELMNGVSNDLIRHSMAVAATAVMIAKGLNWVFPQTLEKLALAGLLHDVGMKELPKELVEKPRHLMTGEEIEKYETHVFRGVEILRSMPSISDDLIAMIYEHHENAIGQGYPRKLRDFKMNPLAKVIALADSFVDLTLKNANNPTPKTCEKAIGYLEITLGQPFNKPAFIALKQILNHKAKKKQAS